MKVIICTNQTEFDSLNDRLYQGLLQDVSGYKADRWDEYNEDLRVAIEPRVEKYLTEEEQARIVDYIPEEVLDA